MKLRLRMLACGSILLFGLAAPAAAQYLRITTDNPTDNTRLRATGTTILTITLDTNHDKSGTQQTCNSHQVAFGCPGAIGTAQPLDMFGYTIALKAVGGTVQWGTFTPSDANYTNSSPQIQNITEVEVNQFRPTGTFTPPGAATIGTIPVTILSGTPAIQLKVGYSQPTDLNPAGFGTGFATECDGTQNFNYYIVGDPSDPCGANPGGPANGLAGDWFDWDGAAASGPPPNNPPALDPISNMTIGVGGCAPGSADQAIHATDPDGQTITFTFTGPSFMTVTSNPQVGNVRTGNIHLTSPTSASGPTTASVTASDGVGGSDTKSFTIQVVVVNQPPVLAQPANMTVFAPSTAEQTIAGSDPCGAALTFFKASGPGFMTVTTQSATTGNIHLAPSFSDQGTFTATVTASNGSLSDSKSFTITVGHSDFNPVLTQPSNMTVNEGATANQGITARDAEADPMTFSVVSGPAFMTLTLNAQVGDTRTANINLAPTFSDAGTYGATIRVSDPTGGADSKSFTITVNDVNRPPFLNQPANMTVTEGATADQTLSASDPDGNSLTFSKTSGPSFMSVTTTNVTTGNIHLAPGFSDSGSYGATVTASDGALSSSRSFSITVNQLCRPPFLAQPANMTVFAGSTADQAFTATSPDGDAITFTSVGPAFMTRTDNPQSGATRTGNIHLAPSSTTSGTFAATVTATVGGACPGSDSKSFTITVCSGGAPPLLAQPANMSVNEGATADQALSATDPDGNPLTFAKATGPAFMTVTTTSPGTGTATGNVHLAPSFLDRGTYNATVTISDGGLCNATNAKNLSITVTPPPNRCPVANPVGPYSGLTGVPVSFDGTASSDPDGNPLTYAWDFDASDGITVDGVGATVSHSYSAAGTYTVTLTVTDNGNGDPAQVCSRSATTTATIAAACDAAVFNGYDTIRLGSGKPFWFAYVQPANTCYDNSDVVISSFVMKYAGRQIFASGKTAIGIDKSGDGIQEIKISFSKDDLRTLFTGTGLGNGHNTVTVILEANLATGGRLSGATQLDVVNNGSFNVAVSPNPLNPQATLSWTTSRAGFARIEMFDVQGRLVRRLVDEPTMAAGAHEATIDGRNQRGESLASGVYFIRGTLSEGAFKQIITILK